jgi:predicted  nucleic acid-binding Zn-ribbon protein
MDKQILDLLKKMDSRLAKIEINQEEHGQILRALDERTQVLSADMENTKHEVSEIKGEIVGLRKDLNLVELATANNWADIVKLKAK